MPKMPPSLADFSDDDVAWLIHNGTRRVIPSGEAILVEGEPVEQVCIILDGGFVSSGVGAEGAPLRADPGEVVGAVSYASPGPAPCTVRAEEDSIVLCIAFAALDERLRRDAGFARRFHRVVSGATAAMQRPGGEAPGGKQGRKAWEDKKMLSSLRVDELIERMLRGDFL